jgi:hypothetical protein
MRNLTGKVAVVTGAGSGIGRATAAALAREGVAVAVCDLDEAAARRTVETIGADATAHQVDVSSEGAMRELVDKVLAEHAAVDIVVNNAGIGMLPSPSAEYPLERFRAIMDVNFWGVVYGSLFFLPHLQTRPEANLVNVTSWAGLVATGGAAAYNSSKFGARGFTETLRMELHGSPVSVTLVCPGFTRTGIFTHSPTIDPEEGSRIQAKFEHQRAAIDPAKVGEAIVAGIRKNKPRVLPSLDGKVMDLVVRVIPGHYSALLARPVRFGVAKVLGLG